jgi:hypothetical protein
MNIQRPFSLGLLHTLFLSLALFSGLLASTQSQAAPSIMLPDSSFDLQITPYLSIYEDEANTLAITDILSPEYQLKFSPSHSDNLRFSLSDSSYWLRFSITNPHAKDQSLVLSFINNR